MSSADEAHRFRLDAGDSITCALCGRWYDDALHMAERLEHDRPELAGLVIELEILVESYSRRIRALESELEQLRRDVNPRNR